MHRQPTRNVTKIVAIIVKSFGAGVWDRDAFWLLNLDSRVHFLRTFWNGILLLYK